MCVPDGVGNSRCRNGCRRQNSATSDCRGLSSECANSLPGVSGSALNQHSISRIAAAEAMAPGIPAGAYAGASGDYCLRSGSTRARSSALYCRAARGRTAGIGGRMARRLTPARSSRPPPILQCVRTTQSGRTTFSKAAARTRADLWVPFLGSRRSRIHTFGQNGLIAQSSRSNAMME